jgi:hypothetical protein
MSEIDEQDLYLEPKRHIPCGVPLPWRWHWWIVLGIASILLLGAGSLAIALGARYLHREPPVEVRPTMTLVPTYTPQPQATPAPPVVTLSVRPWTDDRAPVGMVEVTLSLPAAAQVSFRLPPGFRYWRGDLLQTRQGLGWSGSDPGEVRWYLLREPGATLPATLEVTANGRTLTITLQPATPATTSVPLE